MVGTAALPVPLKRFRSRISVFGSAPDMPEVRFPPDGAVLRLGGDGVPLKLASGVLPLTVLIDGAPALTNLHRREVQLPLENQGFTRISVIDAKGRSSSVQIRLQ